jgi:hypothetical protein
MMQAIVQLHDVVSAHIWRQRCLSNLSDYREASRWTIQPSSSSPCKPPGGVPLWTRAATMGETAWPEEAVGGSE